MNANALATLGFLRAWYGGPSLLALARTVRARRCDRRSRRVRRGVAPSARELVVGGALFDLAFGGAVFAIVSFAGSTSRRRCAAQCAAAIARRLRSR
jgi:hypothetical protein